ncbi:MAG: hypothetical protein ACYCZN_04590 [Candidatus Dormibacteria bacterium]
MTEKDMGLKAASRRLMWSMGFSTLVDVPLRTFVPPGGGRKATEEFTDLDVLGVHVAPDLRTQTSIVDCKTTVRGRAIERVFWLRGVADYFCADDAYMVRTGTVAPGARQLAGRLNLAVLTEADLVALQEHYPEGPGIEVGAADFLFNPAAIADHRAALAQLDKRLTQLRQYQQYGFWMYDPFRNVQQLVAQLQTGAGTLDPSIPVHRAVFADSAWQYVLTLANAAHHVRRTSVTDVSAALEGYLFGGQLGLREKRQLATLLAEAAGRTAAAIDQAVLPPYYNRLLELVTRFLRRPTVVTTALRYAEWLAGAATAGVDGPVAPVATAFSDGFDAVAAKRLADVCAFLVEAAQLDSGFTSLARRLLAPMNGVTVASTIDIAVAAPESSHSAKPKLMEGEEQRPLPLEES